MKFTLNTGTIVQIHPRKDQVCELTAEPLNSACFFFKKLVKINTLFNFSKSWNNRGCGC